MNALSATPVAAQLYTLRNYRSLEDRLLAVAEAGYDGVETLGAHDMSARDLKAKLERHGLEVCSSHWSPRELFGDLDTALRFSDELGDSVLVFPWLAPDERPGHAEGWRELGRRLGGLARQARDAGKRLLYHNHDFEMARFGDALALDLVLEEAGEALGLELDLAWVVRGGEDPQALLARYAGRVPRVHVKDLAAEGENASEGGWADVGHGRLDFASLLPAAKRAGAEWFVVEHDQPRDPLRTLRRSLVFLRAL